MQIKPFITTFSSSGTMGWIDKLRDLLDAVRFGYLGMTLGPQQELREVADTVW